MTKRYATKREKLMHRALEMAKLASFARAATGRVDGVRLARLAQVNESKREALRYTPRGQRG